ncbi:hypothetical protein PBAC_24180 [Pedobacter glucosidilyticus]|uniref:hypothetical protein n=1 Tax=Pedobacter aquae TaxID=2605747 RepID=UPI0005832F77|nr:MULTISPECIES: hypothetical protein [Pedobacter]KHJ37350.1 hypothetical protein PBAC_24180 [Pedobacter glucosidilyticus]
MYKNYFQFYVLDDAEKLYSYLNSVLWSSISYCHALSSIHFDFAEQASPIPKLIQNS